MTRPVGPSVHVVASARAWAERVRSRSRRCWFVRPGGDRLGAFDPVGRV